MSSDALAHALYAHEPGLAPLAILALAIIADAAGPDGLAQVAERRLVDLTGAGLGEVRAAIASLVDAGELEIVDFNGLLLVTGALR